MYGLTKRYSGKMHTVAHYKRIFLEPSEAFIYDQVRNIKPFRHIVLASKTKSQNLFPFRPIYTTSNLSFLDHIKNELSIRINRSSAFFEDIIRKEGVDLIHSHFANDAILMVATKRNVDIPMVTSFYGYDATAFPMKHRGVYDKLFKYGDMFFVLGKYMEKRLEKLGCEPEKIKVNHLGIDTKKFRKGKKDGMVFVTVARFVEKKGIEYSIAAFKELAKKYDAEYRIVGDGPLAGRYMNLAKGCDKIKFINNFAAPDSRKVVNDEIKNADVFVLTSVVAGDGSMEGTPVSLMEAQCSELPCISTYHSDIPEIVINGKTGWLVKERDVKGIQEKMKDLIENPGRRKTFGRNGRRHIIKEFDQKKQLHKIGELYKEVLE